MEQYPKLYFKGIGKPKNYKELLTRFYTEDNGTYRVFSNKVVYYDKEMTNIEFNGYAFRSIEALYKLCKGWFPRVTYFKLIKFLATCKIGRIVDCPDIEKPTYYRIGVFFLDDIIQISKSTTLYGYEEIENKSLREWNSIITKEIKENGK